MSSMLEAALQQVIAANEMLRRKVNGVDRLIVSYTDASRLESGLFHSVRDFCETIKGGFYISQLPRRSYGRPAQLD